MSRRSFLVLLTLALLFCPLFGQQTTPPATIAEVDGEKISLQELNDASGEPLVTLEEQVYKLRQQKLDQMIDDRLLAREAKRRNVPLEALIDAEVTSKAAAVTPDEIHRVYDLNKNQLQKPESEVEGQLRSAIHDQHVMNRRHEFARSLRANARVNVYLEPPDPFRAAVGVDGPSRGPANAPVTIVEFEDFQCPFCKKAQETVQQLLIRYKDTVRLVHRDFPLQPLHPAAWKAHEAGRCAEQQGKFWEYHDLLYKNPPAAGPEQLTAYASQLGMDSGDFKKCLDSGKFKAVVQRDEDEGDRLGVQGTPAFFINGRPLSGAQPESEFSRIIEEELNRRTQR